MVPKLRQNYTVPALKVLQNAESIGNLVVRESFLVHSALLSDPAGRDIMHTASVRSSGVRKLSKKKGHP
jgi:hypothetical protein